MINISQQDPSRVINTGGGDRTGRREAKAGEEAENKRIEVRTTNTITLMHYN